MGEFWRKISKGVFYLTAISSFIGVIFATDNISKIDEDLSVGFFIASIIVMLIVFCVFGMLIEFFDNVAMIRVKICDEKTYDKVIAINNAGNSELDIEQNRRMCECGYILNKGSLYCPSCGEKQK